MVIVKTAYPNNLLSEIKKAIDAKKIETWSYDSDGDFTHTPEQWNKKAWLKPNTESGDLQLKLIGQSGVETTKEVYGVYHGRFIEMLLAHFGSEFTSANATPM